MGQQFKTINAGEASAEVLEQVKKDQEEILGFPVSYSEAIQIASAAYFELKQLKIKERQNVDSNVQS